MTRTDVSLLGLRVEDRVRSLQEREVRFQSAEKKRQKLGRVTGSLGHWAGCMGMSFGYGRQGKQEMIR